MTKIAAWVAVLLLTAAAARADGLNLAWGNGCWSENPTLLLTFACNQNVGIATLTCSIRFDQPPRTGWVDGYFVYLDVQSDSPALPDWWQFRGCRTEALSPSADFSGAPGGCASPWSWWVVYASSWCTAAVPCDLRPPAANRAHYSAFVAVDAYVPQPGVEYYALQLNVDFRRSVGVGACAGCSTPVTIVLNEMSDSDWGHSTWRINNPIANTCVRWQANGLTPCSATPATNLTWGQVKSLYR